MYSKNSEENQGFLVWFMALTVLICYIQIKNQEPNIENEPHQIQSEQEDPCQMIECGLEDLCPEEIITENKNVTDIQGDEHLVPWNDNINHESFLKQIKMQRKLI